MMPNYRIVVSAENNAYVAWQAKLFHFSCVNRLQHLPMIVVHDRGSSLHPDFLELAKLGATVCPAPSFRLTSTGEDYIPRNTAGTLLQASQLCSDKDEFIVLCDPDMIFVRQPDFPRTLSGEHYAYMRYDGEPVRAAALKIGISLDMLERQSAEISCGVPYVIPLAAARLLAEQWLHAIDAFSARHWEDVMHAFGLAVVKLGLKVTLTHIMNHNYWPDALLEREVIHYCYGDDRWDKRQFFREEHAGEVWSPSVDATPGTILAEVVSQIRQAKDFYSDSSAFGSSGP